MKTKLTDVETTGGTEGQVPTINSSGILEYQDGGSEALVLILDCGNAPDTGVAAYRIEGGSA